MFRQTKGCLNGSLLICILSLIIVLFICLSKRSEYFSCCSCNCNNPIDGLLCQKNLSVMKIKIPNKNLSLPLKEGSYIQLDDKSYFVWHIISITQENGDIFVTCLVSTITDDNSLCCIPTIHPCFSICKDQQVLK